MRALLETLIDLSVHLQAAGVRAEDSEITILDLHAFERVKAGLTLAAGEKFGSFIAGGPATGEFVTVGGLTVRWRHGRRP